MRFAAAALLVLAVFPALVLAVEVVLYTWGVSLIPWVERAVGPVCHHLVERTLPLFPVCARCTGLYLGAGVGWLAVFVPPRPRPFVGAVAVVLGSGTLGFVAAVAEVANLVDTSNGVRVFLGLLLGFPMPALASMGARALRDG